MDPTSFNQFIFRVTGLTASLKDHITENPQYAGLYEIDPTTPSKKIKKAELPKLLIGKVLPSILEAFDHLDDNDIIVWEAGLFDQPQISEKIDPEKQEAMKKICAKVLESL
jgi:hypothetical protein